MTEAIAQMSRMYKEHWCATFRWNDESFHPYIFAEGEDTNTIAGKTLHQLKRHCALDYWTTPDLADTVQSFEHEGNYFVIYPMCIGSSVLTPEEAKLGVSILSSSGKRLEELLKHAGILYEGTEGEKHLARYVIEKALKLPRQKALHTKLLEFLRALGLSSTALQSQDSTIILFKNACYNHFFGNSAHVHRDRLDGRKDPWVTLRCTCAPFKTWSRCEHIADARTRQIPGMLDKPLSSETRHPKGKAGRKKGSCSTTRGQKQSLKQKVIKTKQKEQKAINNKRNPRHMAISKS